MELPEREELLPELRYSELLLPLERLTLPEEELPELTVERLPLREAEVLAERETADTPEREAEDTPERVAVEREVLLAERATEEALERLLVADRTLAPPEDTVPIRTERVLLPTCELRAVPTRVEVTLRISERKAPPRALYPPA